MKILMDYVDFIVHVFSPEKRAFYGLERLRKSATTISVAELNAELKRLIASTRTRTTKQSPAKETAADQAVKKSAKKAAKKSSSTRVARVAKASSDSSHL